ncbi:MAG: ABC transporter permease [bacterium]|nr:ABC transporter permease [bacterium]
MNKVFPKIISVVVFFLSWHLLVQFFSFPAYILPSPLEVFNVLIGNIEIISFNAVITFLESFTGFLLANLISILIALLIAFHNKLEDVVMPIAIVIKTMPIIAIVPLLIIWFGPGVFSKIVTAMLICFFPALVNVLRGIKCLDRDLLALFRVYAADRKQLTKMLILPAIMPYLFAAFKVSSSLSVIGALVGEFISSNKGLGFLIISSYYNMNTALVLAAVAISSIMGLSFYYAINFFEKRMVLKSELMV